MKKITFVVLALVSGYAMAQIYNHGNHNDPQVLFGTNSLSTINCGTSDLATCINGVNLSNTSLQWCRNKVVDDTDGMLPWGQPYYHGVQSYAVHIMSALDQDGASNTNDYVVDVRYSCAGFLHSVVIDTRKE